MVTSFSQTSEDLGNKSRVKAGFDNSFDKFGDFCGEPWKFEESIWLYTDRFLKREEKNSKCKENTPRINIKCITETAPPEKYFSIFYCYEYVHFGSKHKRIGVSQTGES